MADGVCQSSQSGEEIRTTLEINSGVVVVDFHLSVRVIHLNSGCADNNMM